MKISIKLRIFLGIILLGWLPVYGMDRLPTELLATGQSVPDIKNIGFYLDAADSAILAGASKGFNEIFGVPNADYHASEIAQYLDENEVWPLHYVALHATELASIKINDRDVACDVRQVIWNLVKRGNRLQHATYVFDKRDYSVEGGSMNPSDGINLIDIAIRKNNQELFFWLNKKFHDLKETHHIQVETVAELFKYLGKYKAELQNKRLFVTIDYSNDSEMLSHRTQHEEQQNDFLEQFDWGGLRLFCLSQSDVNLLLSSRSIQKILTHLTVWVKDQWNETSSFFANIAEFKSLEVLELDIDFYCDPDDLTRVFSSSFMQKKLKVFDFSTNFEDYQNGNQWDVCPEIGNLSALRKLSFSSCVNNFKLPDSIGCLHNLQVLQRYQRNSAVNPIFERICSYENLQESLCELCLDSNLQILPELLLKFRRLWSLYLFNGTVSVEEFRRLCNAPQMQQNLEELNLSTNDGVLPQEVSLLRKLKKFLWLRNGSDFCALSPEEQARYLIE